MIHNRVRIVDVADALGLSTATVSKVIHGNTEKISDETVKRVQQELERTGYIPNMAGILLARNNSRIIGVVVNDHVKYEGRVLEDGFVMASLNALSHEVNEKGYFLMIKTTADISEIPVFASMWNMDGLILMGFCAAFEPGVTMIWEIPKTEKERTRFYQDKLQELLESEVTAVFAVSDFYALEFMRFLQGKNIKIPKDIQIIGFDDNMASRESNPALTTIHQDASLRAKTAIECIEAMRDGVDCETEIVLPVGLIKRESTEMLACQNS